MEYNFSVTPRMLIIFIFCSILFVLSIFFLGAEVGKRLANTANTNELFAKEKMLNQINDIRTETELAKKSISKLGEFSDKK